MSGMEVWVRRAGTDDVADIVELSSAVFLEDAGRRDPYVSLGWPEDEGRGYFAGLISGDANLCLLAEFAGRTVGYLAGRAGERTTMRPVKVAALESMYVRDGYRGRGVGARLVDEFSGGPGRAVQSELRSWPTRPTSARPASTRERDSGREA